MFLEIAGLSKRFGTIYALNNATFDVRSGEVLGLIGPNGAGKSTLFECLAGILPADGGSIRSGGRPVTARERSKLFFYVPDGIAPWAQLLLGWALDFTVGYFRGRAELREEIVQELELGSLLTRKIGALSKGERKRSLIAIGLLAPQAGLLIDEPFDGVDLRQAREISRILRLHGGRGRTLFLSIHQISDAERFCDRFILLSGGKVRGQGTVQELAAVARSHNPSGSYGGLEEVFLALT